MKQPLVSIIILNWNSGDSIFDCLESVRQQTYSNIEIIVWDNGSTDGSTAKLRAESDIRFYYSDTNLGFSGGEIAAAKHAKGVYLALVNSDAILDSEWTSELMKIATSDISVGAVGSRAYHWEQGKPRETKSFYSYQEVNPYTAGSRSLTYDNDQIEEAGSLSGSAVLVSKLALDEVGYFEPSFFAYYEETDLFARMKRAGYKTLYCPTAHCWHQVAASLGAQSYFYLYLMNRNRIQYAVRNFDNGFIGRLLARYLYSELRNLARILRHGLTNETKARRDAFGWNLKHILHTLKGRRSVVGKSNYNSLLLQQMRPSITVVITNYNYGAYLDEAIASVASQSMPVRHIIVVDDGSTDESAAILAKYKDTPNMTIVEQKNAGVVAAKNNGWKLAQTEWVIFLDADDTLGSDYIFDLYSSWLKQGTPDTVGFIYNDARYFGARKGLQKGLRYSKRRLKYRNYIHNSALIRRATLKSIDGYSPLLKAGLEDWDLYLSMAQHGWTGIYSSHSSLNYRQHDGLVSRNNEAAEKLAAISAVIRDRHAEMYDGYDRAYMAFRASIPFKATLKARAVISYLINGDTKTLKTKVRKYSRMVTGRK
jgi:GT2 family glycosyltransferase